MPRTTLRLARFEDREKIYRWLAESDATSEMMGPPKFADHPPPTYSEFCIDYDETAFIQGGNFQIYIICADGKEVGSAQYWIQGNGAELDIWIADRQYWGRGIGSTSLLKLVEKIKMRSQVEFLVIRPSARNHRAIAAYKKAGFEEFKPNIHKIPRIFEEEGFDYYDAVILVQPLN